MTTSILRTADAWWVHLSTGAAKIDTSATTTGQLLADRDAIAAAATSSHTVPVDSLDLLSPVTAPCRVVAQMTNFRSHVKDAGMDPDTIPLTSFVSPRPRSPDHMTTSSSLRTLACSTTKSRSVWSSVETSRSALRSVIRPCPITWRGWSSPTM